MTRPREEKLEIVAHYIWGPTPPERAPLTREWMDATRERFAYRCLPLVIANQSGWIIRNDEPFDAIWDGGADVSAIRIRSVNKKAPSRMVKSHFGTGVLTWHIPYLFRTSPGFNLLVRGPANWPKDGVQPLEGVVESDWAFSTFTMNWKMTRTRRWVRFERGDPICMVVPQRRGELESFHAGLRPLTENAELFEGYTKWSESRSKFQVVSKLRGSEAFEQQWQKHYFRGTSPGQEGRVREHQTQLNLRSFVSESDRDSKGDEDGGS